MMDMGNRVDINKVGAMFAKHRVHIRPTQQPSSTVCGTRGESISELHYKGHVKPNRTDCCLELYAKLCPDCVETLLETEDLDRG